MGWFCCSRQTQTAGDERRWNDRLPVRVTRAMTWAAGGGRRYHLALPIPEMAWTDVDIWWTWTTVISRTTLRGSRGFSGVVCCILLSLHSVNLCNAAVIHSWICIAWYWLYTTQSPFNFCQKENAIRRFYLTFRRFIDIFFCVLMKCITDFATRYRVAPSVLIPTGADLLRCLR